MHLLYARFFTKAVRDLGLIDFDEPFLRLFNQGTVLSGHMKMSKSRGNVIAPDDYVKNLGADVVRLYLSVHGPVGGRRRLERLRHQRRRPLGEPPLGPLPEAHRRAPRKRSRLRPGHHPQDAPDHPLCHRGAGALQVQHRHRRHDGTDQRDVARIRRRQCLARRMEQGGRVAAPAARADGPAPLRGGCGSTRVTRTASTTTPCRSGTRRSPPSRRQRSSCR